MSVTPDKSALAQARERLEAAYALCASNEDMCAHSRPADLRLVLDALKEAERIRHKPDAALSAKVGYPTCGKCGVVIPEPETCCRGTHGKINLRTEDSQ